MSTAQLVIRDILVSPIGFPTGTIVVQYSHALNANAPPEQTSEVMWDNEVRMKEEVESFVETLGERGLLIFLLAAAYLKSDGTFNSIASVRGKKVTADVYNANPLKVQ